MSAAKRQRKERTHHRRYSLQERRSSKRPRRYADVEGSIRLCALLRDRHDWALQQVREEE